VGYGLSVVAQNRRVDEDGARHASRSSGLLRLKVSLTRVSQSSLKTGGGTTQMVHVATSWRSRGDESEDGRVHAMGYIRLFYPNFAIFVVLGDKDSLVISFSIKRVPRVGREDPAFNHPSPTPSQSCFLRGVDVIHGVREERRESERSLQSSKEWEDVVAVSTPCKLLICINTFVCLSKIISYLVLQCFSFSRFLEVFFARFLISSFEEFFIDSFCGFQC
jgi:hypothetical protein